MFSFNYRDLRRRGMSEWRHAGGGHVLVQFGCSCCQQSLLRYCLDDKKHHHHFKESTAGLRLSPSSISAYHRLMRQQITNRLDSRARRKIYARTQPTSRSTRSVPQSSVRMKRHAFVCRSIGSFGAAQTPRTSFPHREKKGQTNREQKKTAGFAVWDAEGRASQCRHTQRFCTTLAK